MGGFIFSVAFEKFSSTFKVVRESGHRQVEHYVDDFLFVGEVGTVSVENISGTGQDMESANSKRKREGSDPVSQLVYLGN